MSINWLKALVALTAIVAVVLMTLFGGLEPTAGFTLIGTIVGYVLGNGVQARNGADVPGIIRPRRSADEEA